MLRFWIKKMNLKLKRGDGMAIDERLYELKKEFDEPISQELLDEIETINQTIGNVSVEELLRQFTI